MGTLVADMQNSVSVPRDFLNFISVFYRKSVKAMMIKKFLPSCLPSYLPALNKF